MGIMCLKCNHIEMGKNGLHIFSKCPNCGNAERDKFFRVDDEDIDPYKYDEDRKWLESHTEE